MNRGTTTEAVPVRRRPLGPHGMSSGATERRTEHGSPDDRLGMIHGTTPPSNNRPGVGSSLRANAMKKAVWLRDTSFSRED
jgi:hypothetical protein